MGISKAGLTVLDKATEVVLGVKHRFLDLGGHPNPAIDGHRKTGHRLS